MFDLSLDSQNTFFPSNINVSNSKTLDINLGSFCFDINNSLVSSESDNQIALPILQQAITLVKQTLTSTAESDSYDMITGLAFGIDYNQDISNLIKESFVKEEFGQLPNVQVISSHTLGNADAAYAKELNTIFLSDDFVKGSNQSEIAGALLEEVGHYIDAQINIIDFAGDEGEVFSRLIQGEHLDASELTILQQEDDNGVINFNEQKIDVEFKNIKGNKFANTLKGTNKADRIRGLGGNDQLTGLGGKDVLDGGAGNDTLDGGTVNDRMIGGPGNDYYFVGEKGDSIKEVAKRGGNDTVNSSINYTLPNNVENLILTGTKAFDGQGNKQANQITGNDIDNLLTGLGGKDKLLGLAGDDWLIGGEGSDCLDGGIGDDFLFGYDFSNKEIDTLIGGIGADTFSLGDNISDDNASVYYDKNGDLDYAVIKDFDISSDKIELLVVNSVIADSTEAFGYSLVMNDGNTELWAEGDELIAVIEGVTDLSLQGSYFSLIGETLPGNQETLPGNQETLPGPREIADSLWDAGKTMGEIGAELKNHGFDLPEIADAVYSGITKSDGSEVTGTELASALLNSGYEGIDARKLADLLWDTLLDPKEIGKAMAGNGFSLEEIADSLNEGIIKEDGNTLRYVNGTSSELIDLGFVQVSENLYRLDTGYVNVAEGLWNSGYEGLDANKLADLLWDEGANAEQIGQAFNHLKLGLETIVSSLTQGITKIDGSLVNVTELTTALWNSGYGIDTRKLAQLLSTIGASNTDIGKEILSLGFDVRTVTDALSVGVYQNDSKDSTSRNYRDVALAITELMRFLGVGEINIPGDLADFLWDEYATQEQIGLAMHDAGFIKEHVAHGVKWRITKSDGSLLNWADTANAIWIDQFSISEENVLRPIDLSWLTDLLWDMGANSKEIGEAISTLKNINLTLEDIAYNFKFGITKSDGTNPNYSEIAIALLNSGKNFTFGELADLFWDMGASLEDISKAMWSANLSLETIASSIKLGITKSDGINPNYNETAFAIMKSGYYVDAKKLADLLWDTGANPIEIGQAMRYVDFNLESIADGLRYGVTKSDGNKLNYSSIAEGLWHSGHGLKGSQLADLLSDRGASPAEIGQAFNGLNFTAYQIFYTVKNGVTTYKEGIWGAKGYEVSATPTDAAIAVKYSGVAFSWSEVADWMWDAGNNKPEDIGRSLQWLGLGLKNIAEALKGVTKSDGSVLNYTEFGTALKHSGHSPDAKTLAYLVWNNGHSMNARQLADFIYDQGYDLNTVAQTIYQLNIRTEKTGPNEVIGDALKHGITPSPTYKQVAEAIKQAGENPAPGADRLAIIAIATGAGESEVVDILRGFSDGKYNGQSRFAFFQTTENNAYLKYDLLKAKQEIFDPLYNFIKANVPWLAQLIDDTSDAANKGGDYIAKTADDMADDARQLSNDFKNVIKDPSEIIDVTKKLTNNLVKEIGDSIGDIDLKSIVDGLKQVPWVGTIVGAINAGIAAINGNEIEILKNVIDGVLAYFGMSSVITPRIVDFVIDLAWPLLKEDYKGAIGRTLTNFGMKETLSQLFTNVAWSLADKGDDWKTLIGSAVNAVGLKNGDKLVDIAWDFIDKNYKDAIKGGLELIVEIGKLDINQDKINIFVDTAWSMASNGDWKPLINATLKFAGVKESDALGNIASHLIDQNYKEAIKGVLQLVGTSKLGIDQAKADLFVDTVWSMASNGDWKPLINETLKFAGVKESEALGNIASHVIDKNYKEAIKGVLQLVGTSKLDIDQAKADLFVDVAWSMASNGDWKPLINKALKFAGVKEYEALGKIASNVIDKNYQDTIKDSFTLIGLSNLRIDQAKADLLINVITSIQGGNTSQVADTLITFAGNQPEIRNSIWIKQLKDNNLSNDKQALQTGLSELGFSNAKQWTDTIWAVKDEKYLDALSKVFTIGNFTEGQEWLNIINNLQKNDPQGVQVLLSKLGFSNAQQWTDTIWAVKDGKYLDALSKVFTIGNFTEGQEWLNIINNLQKNDPQGVQALLSKLGFSNAQQWADTIWAVKDGKYLDALSNVFTMGNFTEGQEWLNIINNLQKDDPQGVQALLSKLGFSNAKQWADTIWAIKDGRYLEALSGVASLGDLPEIQDGLKIIDSLQKEDYLTTLKTAFNSAGFQNGESLANAALAVKNGKYMDAFIEAMKLIDGPDDLVDAFQYLKKEDYPKFVHSLLQAVPFITKVLSSIT